MLGPWWRWRSSGWTCPCSTCVKRRWTPVIVSSPTATDRNWRWWCWRMPAWGHRTKFGFWSTSSVVSASDSSRAATSAFGRLAITRLQWTDGWTRRVVCRCRLTSPSGTQSVLLFERPRDMLESNFEDWPFMTVHFWGERAAGTWKLEVINAGNKRVNQPGIINHGISWLSWLS